MGLAVISHLITSTEELMIQRCPFVSWFVGWLGGWLVGLSAGSHNNY